jgi:large subunit ribosomal protein L13
MASTARHKTWTPRKQDLTPEWYVVDASGVALGRLASAVAKLLKGKHKPTYTPHLNTGDHVVVVNASRVVVTGTKAQSKSYTRYSGYPSGLRRRTVEQAQALDPTFPVYNAVRGMLQRNTLGGEMLKRLRVYAGPEHEQQAQKPRAIKFNERGDPDFGG